MVFDERKKKNKEKEISLSCITFLLAISSLGSSHYIAGAKSEKKCGVEYISRIGWPWQWQ